ncbi:hypothetical protein [Candidatus Nitronereus thalassa]|uniref:Uncharacterized protein n=1 Tax=Candidatus Nitronereus thalassa TaxID=3020898 RepID=A0ABU3K329_9BACT|nr:hypothetical protein [Candidatus Nitronereus thalassa]MDT7040797.1 hypothetical protein [Candidatus Nitronereus thalassa]
MPYVFPYENVFMGGIAILIVALLIFRVKLARQQRRRTDGERSVSPSTEMDKDSFPLV